MQNKDEQIARLTATIAEIEREVVFLNEKINEYQNLHRLELEAMGKLEDTIDQQKKEIDHCHREVKAFKAAYVVDKQTINKLTQENESLKKK